MRNPLKQMFSSERIPEYHHFVKEQYFSLLAGKYQLQPSCALSNKGVDSSVDFIGSTISALKPLYVGKKIPSEGAIIFQPCIRLHNLERVYSAEPNKGNIFFNMVGGITNNSFQEVYTDSMDFFIHSLGIDSERMIIRASSKDLDIIEGLKRGPRVQNLEIDTRLEKYYRWKYGLDQVLGRGIAIAVKNETLPNKSITFGNIVIMESQNYARAIQWGYGIEAIVGGCFSKERVLEGSQISAIIPYETSQLSKLSDILAASMEMAASGMKPNKEGVNKHLKFCLKGAAYLADSLRIEEVQLDSYCRKYSDIRGFFNKNEISERIINYLKECISNRRKLELDISKIARSHPYGPEDISVLSNRYRVHPKEVEIMVRV